MKRKLEIEWYASNGNKKTASTPQVFRPTNAWFESFYTHVNKEYPWFGGIVFGPWIKTPIKEIKLTIITLIIE